MLYLSGKSEINDIIELNLLRSKDSIYDFHLLDINIFSSSTIKAIGKYVGKFGNHHLIMDPHTTSWALIDEMENKIYTDLLIEKSFKSFLADSKHQNFNFKDFFKTLFNRGLVSIDGICPYETEFYQDNLPYHDGLLVELLVTEKCNLTCLYCQANARIDKTNMTKSIALTTIGKAFELNYDTIIFEISGGEPLLNFPLIISIIDEIEKKASISRKSAIIALVTNGTLLSTREAEFIKEHNIKLSVSFDGPDDINKLSRPFGNKKIKIADIIKKIRDNKILLNILLTVNRHNFKYAEEIACFLNKLEVNSVKINPVAIVGRASEKGLVEVSNKEYFRFIEKIYDNIIINNMNIPEFHLSEILNRLITKFRDYRCMRCHCNAGKSYFVVDSIGKIFPCAQMTGYSHVVLGNVLDLDRKLDELSAENEFINCFNSREVSENIHCSNCFFLKLCEGGCIVEMLSEQTVDFRSVISPLCEYYQSIYSYIFTTISLHPERVDAFLKSPNFRYSPAEVEIKNFTEPKIQEIC